MSSDFSIQEIIDYNSKLEDKEKTTIRFFERSKSGTTDRYIVVGDDAVFMANEVRGTKHALKGDEEGNTSDNIFLPVSKVQFESEVRDLLLSLRYKVQMYVKDNNEWLLDFEATPGNLGPLEDLVYSSADHLNSRGLLVVSVLKKDVTTIGTAYVDMTGKTIDVCHFEDDDNYSNFESLLVMLAPRECLVNKKFIDTKLIEKLNFNKISVTCVPFDKKYDREILEDYIKVLTTREKYEKVALNMINDIPEPAKLLVTDSLYQAIAYLNLVNDSSHQFDIKEVKPRLFMRLDMTAVSSLNLFPDTEDVARVAFEAGKGDRKTVFSLLNRCRTFPGQRLLSQWIRQPLIDRNKIEERLSLVSFFVEEVEIRNIIYEDKLRKVPDLVKLSKKFASKTSTLTDMYSAYLFIKTLPSLIETLGHDDMFIRVNFTEQLEKCSENLEMYQNLVEEVIDLDKYYVDHELTIKADFDSDLTELRKQLESLEQSSQSSFKSALKQLNLSEDDVKLEEEKDEFYFIVSNKKEKLIRSKDDIFDIIDTKSNSIKFVNMTLLKVNESYSRIKKELEFKQKEVINEIKTVVQTYYEVVKQLGDIISMIDVIVSFAISAVSGSYVRPQVLPKGSGKLVVKQVRHPCLESQGIDFIPNDVQLEEDKHKFLLITGPNMGGKSTYIRSIGIATLMTQIGSFVAAESATITIVDAIFTRIGSNDSQLEGNSTFMTEMIETASILRSATENSLVIIDELGRGTSTFDGFGLAWSLSKHIATQVKSFTLFATHYHELTKLADEVDSIGNVHVSAFITETEVVMTYQVAPGVCDQSYGIHVAKLAGFPHDMVEKAERKLNQLDGGDTQRLDLKRSKQEIKSFNLDSGDVMDFIKKIKSQLE